MYLEKIYIYSRLSKVKKIRLNELKFSTNDLNGLSNMNFKLKHIYLIKSIIIMDNIFQMIYCHKTTIHMYFS